MPRPYHSVSSISAARPTELGGSDSGCIAWWIYRYLGGVSDPPSKSADLGTQIHEIGENYFALSIELIDWDSKAGRCYGALRHLLPTPEVAHASGPVLIERPIGDVPAPVGLPAHAPPLLYRAHGVLWAGFVDLEITLSPAEAARLHAPAGEVIHDYKSTSNIRAYAHTPESLLSDLQANLYAHERLTRSPQLTAAYMRWLYTETSDRGVGRVAAVCTTITGDAADRAVSNAAAFARDLDTLSIEDASRQEYRYTSACHRYGKICPAHVSQGGPCDARASGAATLRSHLAQLRKKSMTQATVGSKFRDRIAAQKSADATPAPDADAVSDAAGTVPEGGDAAAESSPHPATASKVRTPRVKASTTPPGSLAERLAPLVKDLADAEAAVLAAREAIAIAMS